MSGIKGKVKSLVAKSATKSKVLYACVVIALALALFFIALFAPFQYYSNKEVLHTVYIDVEEESSHVLVYQNTRVHQSIFKLFGAAGELGSASTMRNISVGIETDVEKYQEAKSHLDELRTQYRDIYQLTATDAAAKGIATDSAAFQDMLAHNLSRMNLMALDLLETAVQADNGNAYKTIFAGCILGMLGGLVNIFIMLASIVAFIFGCVALVCKRSFDEGVIFLHIFTVLSCIGMLMCVFNPMLPPAAAPLALVCLCVIVYYLIGLCRSLLSGTAWAVKIKNCIIGAVVPISMLILASMPSFTVYVNGLGGRYLYYPGTIGTAYYSWVTAMLTTGLAISGGVIVAANILGGFICLFSTVTSILALDRLFKADESANGVFTFLMFVTAACSVALIVITAAITNRMQASGEYVKYIAGACWYVNAVAVFGSALFTLLFKPRAKKDIAVDPDLNPVVSDDGTASIER